MTVLAEIPKLTPRQRAVKALNRDAGGSTVLAEAEAQAYRACDPCGVQDTAAGTVRVPYLSVVGDDLVLRVTCGTPARKVLADLKIPLAKIDFARALAAEWKNLK